MTHLELLLAAWVVDVCVGWPDRLYRRIRHPVVWLGAFITVLEKRFNRPAWSVTGRSWAGALVSLGCVALAIVLTALLEVALEDSAPGQWVLVAVASSMLATRSLYEHVRAVATPLRRGNLPAARRAVGAIVGRDPATLHEMAVARASLESLAENASDGIVAPLCWGAVFGLPGLAAYKTINTLDSMLGHRSERLRAFGAFPARLDDFANVVPARLTGWLFALASRRVAAHRIMRRDARRHRSPNAGWPEAAMAGALGVRLSGPRRYQGHISDDPWLNPEARDPGSSDVFRGLKLYRQALSLLGLLLLAALLWGWLR